MIKLKSTEWFILIGLLLLSLVPCVGGTLRLLELGSSAQLEGMPDNPRIKADPLPVVIHLVSAISFCILGAFQFLPSFRKMYPRWHRRAGRWLVAAGIFSGLSGLWMTHYYSFPADLQGDLLYMVRLLVGFAMVSYILLGLYAVLKRRFAQHRASMIRAYALGQGAGTQVLVSIPFLVTVGEPSGFTRDVLMTLAWVINVSVAEWIIRRRRSGVSKEHVNQAASEHAQGITEQPTLTTEATSFNN